MLVLFVGVAAAHRPAVISGGTVCAPDAIDVSVTVTSWIVQPDPTSDGRDINDAILVFYSTSGQSGPYTPVPPPGAVDHDTSFGRSFSVPFSTTELWVAAEAQGPWGNGQAPRDIIDASGFLIPGSFTPEDLILVNPDACSSSPAASIVGQCVVQDGELTLSLSNSGPPVASFAWTVTGDNGFSDSGVETGVTSSTPRTITLPGLPDGTYSATATADGDAVPVSGSPVVLTCDLQEPTASIAGECIAQDGQAVLTLSNTGDKAIATFTWSVTGDNGFSDSGVESGVGTGDVRTITLSGLADGTYSASAVADGVPVTVTGSPVVITCDFPEPSASIVGECIAQDGQAVLTLSNTGDATIASFSWSVTGDNGFSDSGVESAVAKGDVRTVTLSGLADGTYSATASADGAAVGVSGSPVVLACDFPVPAASIAGECIAMDGQAVLTLSNTGDATIASFSWSVTGDNGFSDSGVESGVAKGDVRTVTLSGLADGTYSATASADGVPVAVSGSPVVLACDFPEPSASIVGECISQDGEAVLTLSNSGDQTIASFSWSVTGDNGFSDSGVESAVAKGDSRTVTLSGLADGTYSATASADGDPVTVSGSPVVIACDFPEPAASIEGECIAQDGVATLTLSNTGDATIASFSWSVTGDNGFSDSGVESGVAQGEVRTILLTDLPDGTYSATADADGAAVDVTGSPVVVECDLQEPLALIRGECIAEDGQAVLTLENSGDATIAIFAWTVTGDNGFSDAGVEADVATGDVRTITLTMLDDGVYTATASADEVSVPVAGSPLVLTCDEQAPIAELTGECVDMDGAAVLTLSNTGQAAIGSFTWTVSGDNGFSASGEEADVALGEERTIDLADLPDGAYTATAEADGVPVMVVGSPLVVECDEPVPSASVSVLECPATTVDLTLTNDGDAPAIFEVSVVQVGATRDLVEVAGNSSEVLTFGIAEGQTIELRVESGGVLLLDESITRRCVEPVADIDVEKLTNGVQADLAEEAVTVITQTEVVWTYIVTNTGETDLVDVEVNDDIEGFVCIIPALVVGESATCELTGIAGSSLYGNVADTVGCPVDENGDPATKLDGSLLECPTDEDPSHYDPQNVLGFQVECATGGIAVTLSNSSDSPATITVTKNDVAIGVFEVPDNGTFTALVPMEEGEVADIGVFSGDTKVAGAKIDRDCEPEVKGETLARTGSDSGDLARTAGWLMILGGLVMALVRRREYELVPA